MARSSVLNRLIAPAGLSPALTPASRAHQHSTFGAIQPPFAKRRTLNRRPWHRVCGFRSRNQNLPRGTEAPLGRSRRYGMERRRRLLSHSPNFVLDNQIRFGMARVRETEKYTFGTSRTRRQKCREREAPAESSQPRDRPPCSYKSTCVQKSTFHNTGETAIRFHGPAHRPSTHSIDNRPNPVRNPAMKAISAVLAVLLMAGCNKPADVVGTPPPTPIVTPTGPAKSHSGKY